MARRKCAPVSDVAKKRKGGQGVVWRRASGGSDATDVGDALPRVQQRGKTDAILVGLGNVKLEGFGVRLQSRRSHSAGIVLDCIVVLESRDCRAEDGVE